MRRVFMRAKIHRATVTEACLEYVGSLTVDRELMEAADLHPYERVEVYNVTSGHRFATYVIEGPRGRGDICANGAAAHCVRRGDKVIIAAYADLEEDEIAGFEPRLVFVDDDNRMISLEEAEAAATVAPGAASPGGE